MRVHTPFHTCVYVCVRVCVLVSLQCKNESQNNFLESVLSFHHVGSTQVTELGAKRLYPWTHLIGLPGSLKERCLRGGKDRWGRETITSNFTPETRSSRPGLGWTTQSLENVVGKATDFLVAGYGLSVVG